MVNFSLEGKIALVTGASYGIGFGIASAFAEAGATICFNDINQEKVDMGLASYKEKGIEAHGYVCDVTDEEQVKALVAKIKEEVGVIDILVNNAGIIMRKPMLEMEAQEFRKVIDVDLNAPFIVSKAVIPGMIEKGHGKIINICSMMKETSAPSTASTTSSATVSDLDTSRHLRQLRCVSVRQTEADIRLISSSYPRHRLQDGAIRKTFRDRQCSSLPMLLTS